MTELEEKMDDLEKRVLALEERMRRFIWSKDERKARREEELFDRYGEYVDKTTAAQILGVTRATVYKMLDDGRIEGSCGACTDWLRTRFQAEMEWEEECA